MPKDSSALLPSCPGDNDAMVPRSSAAGNRGSGLSWKNGRVEGCPVNHAYRYSGTKCSKEQQILIDFSRGSVTHPEKESPSAFLLLQSYLVGFRKFW